MAYQAEISRANPTCFIFLIDQSASMADPLLGVPGNPRKAIFVADVLNTTIQHLVVLASKDIEVWKYYQIAVLGYGNNTVASALGGSLAEKELVWIDEIYQNPLRIEDRVKRESDGAGGFIEVNTKFPVWIDPVANGNTPMCEALSRAEQILSDWVKEHPFSFPPTVINLTDGEANVGDPRIPAQAIKMLSTNDGNVPLMTIHVSSNPYSTPNLFPDTTEGLPDEPSKIVYEMSSPLSSRMLQTAQEQHNIKRIEGARAIVYNATLDVIVQALEIGSRPANLR